MVVSSFLLVGGTLTGEWLDVEERMTKGRGVKMGRLYHRNSSARKKHSNKSKHSYFSIQQVAVTGILHNAFRGVACTVE